MNTYNKRSGTSGIRGQLYETKLLSLLLYRLKHNDVIEEFHLASNIDGIGVLDDICFRAKLKESDRFISVFIQVKHRESHNAPALDYQKDLIKYFDSYLKIKRAFETKENDVLFNGKFDDMECLFVLYTTANDDKNVILKQMPDFKFASYLDSLIGTSGTVGYLPTTINDDFLCNIAVKEEITSLAIVIAEFISDKVDFRKMLYNEKILSYHVILSQRIMQISDIHQPGEHRIATFREDFFTSDEEFITTFRETLFIEVLKKRPKLNNKTIISYLLNGVDSSLRLPQNLSKLIGNVVTYNKYGKLEFLYKGTAKELKQKLNQVDVSQSTVDEAINLAAKEILSSRSLKVPAFFGNKDLKIRGNDKKIEKRLDYLAKTIIYDLLEKSQSNNIVTIDETLPKGLLQVNGGIAGAIGNILVPDENSTLMKFTDNCEILGKCASRLFEKVKVKIQDIHKYRFEIKIENHPKLLFQASDYKSMVKDFLNKLVFFTNQADESSVEEILKCEIEVHHFNMGNSNVRVKLDAIFLTYHNEIQKWWLLDKGEYLTKETEIHDKMIRKIMEDSQLMCLINNIYMNKIKFKIDYTFKEDTLTSLKLDVPFLNKIIITDTVVITIAKVLQSLKNKDHVVLDLEYISNFSVNDVAVLCTELIATTDSKIIIFVCENVLKARNLSYTFSKIAEAVNKKMRIIITQQLSAQIIKNCFSQTVDMVNDEICNLANINDESRKTILNDSIVVFQGESISLDSIVDEKSMALVEGMVLSRILSKKIIAIGKSLENSNHKEIKHLYVDRRVRQGGSDEKLIENLSDITNDVVLITAKPGMGKSTLLTHISLKTKKRDPSIWIVRINLLEYSREFSKWQENKNIIDTMETLKFMCYVVVSERQDQDNNRLTIELEETNGFVSLKNCVSDQWTVFEVKLFLDFYNRGRIIFLFDGFDEICPHYSIEVMQLLESVKRNIEHKNKTLGAQNKRKHKMWIASRSYNKIKSNLQRAFGICYEILSLTPIETEKYYKKFWESKLLLNELNEQQLDNVHNFIKLMTKVIEKFRSYTLLHKLQNLSMHELYFHAFDYITTKVSDTCIPLWNFGTKFYDEQHGMMMVRKYNMRYNGDTSEHKNMADFNTTPLHLYLLADFFQNEIKDVSIKAYKWDFDYNTFEIFERLLETKMKTIRFQEKNNMDVYIPDNIITYEKELADFIYKHKKMAAYAIFHRSSHMLFSTKGLKEIKTMIESIRNGREKTGFINSITSNNIPIFVHRSFAEYFAVEYFCDSLKSEKRNKKQEEKIGFILNVIFFKSPANFRNILDSKLKMDDELMYILQRHETFILNLLIKQIEGNVVPEITDASSVFLAVYDNLSNFVEFFISIFKRQLKKAHTCYFLNRFQIRLGHNQFVCLKFFFFVCMSGPYSVNDRRFRSILFHQFSFSDY